MVTHALQGTGSQFWARFYGLTWGKQPQRPLDKFDQKLDKFYDCDTRLVRRGRRSARAYHPPRLSTARAPTCQSPP